jgi:hypothetical protein
MRDRLIALSIAEQNLRHHELLVEQYREFIQRLRSSKERFVDLTRSEEECFIADSFPAHCRNWEKETP